MNILTLPDTDHYKQHLEMWQKENPKPSFWQPTMYSAAHYCAYLGLRGLRNHFDGVCRYAHDTVSLTRHSTNSVEWLRAAIWAANWFAMTYEMESAIVAHFTDDLKIPYDDAKRAAAWVTLEFRIKRRFDLDSEDAMFAAALPLWEAHKLALANDAKRTERTRLAHIESERENAALAAKNVAREIQTYNERNAQ